MTWRVVWTHRSQRDLRNLDPDVAVRIIHAVDRLATDRSGDVRRLQGADRVWRLRVGAWRVRFRPHDDTEMIEVLRVLPRGRASRD